MPQEYKITEVSTLGNSNNQIPLNIPNILQNVIPQNLIRIPHPSLTQIGLDLLPIYQIKLNDNPSTQPDEPLKIKSVLGTVLLDQLTFIVYSKDIGGDEFFVNQQGEKSRNVINQTYDDVLINITQAKKIVKTEIAGNNGTVKEFIGLNDYEITIRGRIFGGYNQKPSAQLVTLHKILKVGKTIGIASNHLRDLDISNMVVTSFDIPQNEGEYSTQYFTINGVSDTKPENTFIKFTQ